MLEKRICKIGLIGMFMFATLAWCTKAWYFEVATIISIGTAIFGYGYMEK